MKGDQERRDLLARALKRNERAVDRERDDTRSPDRGTRKSRSTGRK